MSTFIYKLGSWTLEFPQKYRIVCDGTTAVVIDDDRTALVLLSLTEKGNIRIERTYYAMICEIDPIDKKSSFNSQKKLLEKDIWQEEFPHEYRDKSVLYGRKRERPQICGGDGAQRNR